MDGLEFDNHRRGFDFRFGLKIQIHICFLFCYCFPKLNICGSLLLLLILAILSVVENIYVKINCWIQISMSVIPPKTRTHVTMYIYYVENVSMLAGSASCSRDRASVTYLEKLTALPFFDFASQFSPHHLDSNPAEFIPNTWLPNFYRDTRRKNGEIKFA